MLKKTTEWSVVKIEKNGREIIVPSYRWKERWKAERSAYDLNNLDEAKNQGVRYAARPAS